MGFYIICKQYSVPVSLAIFITICQINFFFVFIMSGTTDILAYIASAIIGVALLIIIFKILGSIIYAKKQSL